MRCAPQVHGAARDALALRAPNARDRGQRRDRQPDGLRATTGDIVSGGNFHGAPVGDRRRRHRPRPGPAGDDLRAARRSARQPGAERPAAVPDPRQRAPLGLHDGAGDGRGAGVRAQDTRASGERRHDPDVGQPRRPRQHEHGGGAQGANARSSSRRASSPSRLLLACQAIDLLRRSPRRRRSRRCTRCVRSMCRRSIDDRPPSPDIEWIAKLITERLTRTRVRHGSQVKNFCQIQIDNARVRF